MPTLLSIPREVRDHIYDLLALSDDVFLIKPISSKIVVANSGLLTTCPQIYTEYFRAALRVLPPKTKIMAEVTDMGFEGIIGFINALTAKQIRNINETNRLVIRLIITDPGQVKNGTNLWKWLDCCKSSGIEAQYFMDNTRYGPGNTISPKIKAPTSSGLSGIDPDRAKIYRAVRLWQLEREDHWRAKKAGGFSGVVSTEEEEKEAHWMFMHILLMKVMQAWRGDGAGKGLKAE